MNLSWEPIKHWFGFSRRERRSSFILLLIIVLIVGFRYIIPDRHIELEDLTGSIPDSENLSALSQQEKFSVSKGSSYYSVKIAHDSGKKPNSRYALRETFSSSGNRVRVEKSRQNSVSRQKTLTDLNTGDSAALVRLPGIGPVLSLRIIKYRHLLGGFASVDQLKEVYGLPEETFELIKGRVYADSTLISRININTAAYKELARCHYLEKYEITAILKYRQLKGKINNIKDLTDNKLISAEKASKVRPYLKFDD
jgi:DNA uptake protein ComE-like DNA-binding protein